MKSSHSALAVVGLALAGLWYAGGGTAVPQSAAAEQPRVSSPLAHDNLAVYFVHGPDAVGDDHKVATLQEALDAGWAVVHETGDVNTLAVENRSADTELFVQEGDMIKGGRQDRVIAIDMLVPPKSGRVPFPAHCVEQGRWTGRGAEAATHFNTSDNFAVGKGIRYANASGRQSEVWENVKVQQTKLSDNLGVKVTAAESETSLQLALENRAVQAKVGEFEQALRAAGETRKNVIGVVFVVNGQVTGAEVYGSSALFQKAWPKLLRSAAADAVAEKTDKPSPPAPTVVEVERFLAIAGQPSSQPAGLGTITDDTSNGVLPVAGMGPPGVAFTGRSGATRNRVLTSGGALFAPVTGDNVNPTVSAQSVLMGGSGAGRVDETRLRQIADSWSGQSMEQHARTIEELTAELPARYRPMIEEYFRSLNRIHGGQASGDDLTRAIDNIRREQFRDDERARAAQNAANPQGNVPTGGTVNPATPAAVNPQGNRLTVNRVEDRTGLVSESRDPARQNAVIHRSFIKK